ncbi:hypothetical protein KP509_02G039600 [Ceratopteris richardii]|uniref:Uncharacterized protein n=1 Tax=Ceratopteris richardii TaxID=49495 RepID=A0A8T2VCQ5_CERRI|nr:hypothetical protein KP509_02G039600 [Ceratopteris richardii]
MPKSSHPYWKEHTFVQGQSGQRQGSGTKSWQCMYCESIYSSTITRVICHVSGLGGHGIGGCQKVPKEVADKVIGENGQLLRGRVAPGREELAERDDALLRPSSSSLYSHRDPSPSMPSSASTDDIGRTLKRPASSFVDDTSTQNTPGISNAAASGIPPTSVSIPDQSQSTLRSRVFSDSWVKERKRIAEIEIARTLIECNLSFNVLRTEQWKRMIRSVAAVGTLPDHDEWIGVEYRRMRTTMLDQERERIDIALAPIRDSWARFGCTIMADGWSDFRRRHMINILVSSCLGTIFLRAIDVGIGGQSVTGEFIYRHIREVILEIGAEFVVQIITDNASNCRRMGEMVEEDFPTIVWTPCAAHCLDLMIEDIARLSWIQPVVQQAVRVTTFFRKKHQALAIFRKHSQLDMVRPSKTRFAYMFLVFDRLIRLRAALRGTVVDPQWDQMHVSGTEQARIVRLTLLDDGFWTQMSLLSGMLRSMWALLQLTDSEGCTIGHLYSMFREMRASIEAYSELTDERRTEILQIIDTRCDYLIRPIHGISTLLHPLYKGDDTLQDMKLLASRDVYLSRVLDVDRQIQFDTEFITYANNLGATYSRPTSFRRDLCKSPVNWWQTYGYTTPDVRNIALRVLSQDCSAGACERNWSAYSLVQTKVRNHLSTHQMQRLVYCRANLKVDRDLFLWSDDVVPEPPSTQEEDEIYRMLHRELESVGMRVTRSRAARTSRISVIEGKRASTSSRLAPRGPRPRRGAVRGSRGSSNSRGASQSIERESLSVMDVHLDDIDDIPVISPQMAAIDFDDEGELLVGDIASSSTEDDAF